MRYWSEVLPNLDRTPVVIAAAATGTAAVLVFALLPVLSGALADQYQLDDVQTGLVATSYFSVYALIALSSSTWIRRFDWVKTGKEKCRVCSSYKTYKNKDGRHFKKKNRFFEKIQV